MGCAVQVMGERAGKAVLVGLGPGVGVEEGIGVGVSAVDVGNMMAGGLVPVAVGGIEVGVAVCAGG